jgi:deoxyribodipyrimidine photo-lyase
LYISDDANACEWLPGGASRWRLHNSLPSLSYAIKDRGNKLILRTGSATAIIDQLLSETGATSIYWNRRYEPCATKRDEQIKTSLKDKGIEARSFNSSLFREPGVVKTKMGEPYKVFTPFWKAVRAMGDPAQPKPAPRKISSPKVFPSSYKLKSWELLPLKPNWAENSKRPGCQDKQNFPGITGTSRLSPHLHFGEIGPRQLWNAFITSPIGKDVNLLSPGAEVYLSEIAWREFSYPLLFHFSQLPSSPLRAEFSNF